MAKLISSQRPHSEPLRLALCSLDFREQYSRLTNPYTFTSLRSASAAGVKKQMLETRGRTQCSLPAIHCVWRNISCLSSAANRQPNNILCSKPYTIRMMIEHAQQMQPC
jgi:hypothetical protein